MKIAVALAHVVFATIWLGGAFFYTVILLPKLRALDSAQQRALARSLRATMTPLLGISAAATIVSGLVMMAQLHPLHPGPFSHDRWGIALIVGAVASLGALAVAVIEARAAGRDVGPVEGARVQSLARLFRRERNARLVALALLFVALATMAVARYS